MANEREVLEDARRLFELPDRPDDWRRLVGRWLDDGLPSEPVDGPVGRAQLEHVAGALRELSTEVASVAALVELAPRGFAFADPGRDAETLDRGCPINSNTVSGARMWSDQVLHVANTIDEFIRSGDPR